MPRGLLSSEPDTGKADYCCGCRRDRAVVRHPYDRAAGTGNSRHPAWSRNSGDGIRLGQAPAAQSQGNVEAQETGSGAGGASGRDRFRALARL